MVILSTHNRCSRALVQLSRKPQLTPQISSRQFSTAATMIRCRSSLSSLQVQSYNSQLASPLSHQQHPALLQHQQRRTMMARTSQMEPESPAMKAKTFIINIGHDPAVAKGVVRALEESGVHGEALLRMVRKLAGRWEVGADEGLEALVASVKQNLARNQGKVKVQLWCVPANAWRSREGDAEDFADVVETEEERNKLLERAFSVEAMSGLSLTDVAKFGDGEGASTLGECLECACAGIMACSTCHVVVDPEWYEIVGKPCEAEQDMLDLAYAPRKTSRLGCQIVLDERMDGMVLRLPGGANNLMDYVPFED